MFAERAGSSVDTRRLAYIPEYRVYNREREIERQERERKEKQWEEELNTAMKGAEERLKYVWKRKVPRIYQYTYFSSPFHFSIRPSTFNRRRLIVAN